MKYLPFFAILLIVACSRSAEDDNAITRSKMPDTTKYGSVSILVDTAWDADTTICFK